MVVLGQGEMKSGEGGGEGEEWGRQWQRWHLSYWDLGGPKHPAHGGIRSQFPWMADPFCSMKQGMRC